MISQHENIYTKVITSIITSCCSGTKRCLHLSPSSCSTSPIYLLCLKFDQSSIYSSDIFEFVQSDDYPLIPLTRSVQASTNVTLVVLYLCLLRNPYKGMVIPWQYQMGCFSNVIHCCKRIHYFSHYSGYVGQKRMWMQMMIAYILYDMTPEGNLYNHLCEIKSILKEEYYSRPRMSCMYFP